MVVYQAAEGYRTWPVSCVVVGKEQKPLARSTRVVVTRTRQGQSTLLAFDHAHSS